MTLQLREGGCYKTRDGRKAGPVRPADDDFDGPWRAKNDLDGDWSYDDDGTLTNFSGDGLDLIAEWTEGPVRTVTRKEIVAGVYDHVLVDSTANGGALVLLGFKTTGGIFPETRSLFNATELKAAAAVLLELAGALDSE